MKTTALACVVLLLAFGVVWAADFKEKVAEVQANLAELGYDPGPANGDMGPKTKEAIAAFQKDHDLAADGEYSLVLAIKVSTELEMARFKATPEGQGREEARKRLLAMSTEELAALIESASAEQVLPIYWLAPQKFLDLPLRMLNGKGLRGEATDATISLSLRQLLYPPSPEGISQFQTDIGAKPTEDLTGREFAELQRRVTRQRDTPVRAGGDAKIKGSEDTGWATAEGTLILEDEEIAYPVNSVKIDCDRDRRECQVAQTQLDVPSMDGKSDISNDTYTLLLRSNTYTILSWEPGEIVARTSGSVQLLFLP